MRSVALASVVAISLLATVAHAAPRSPQIPVSGTALQAFFNSQGQTIDVHTQQLDLQTVSLPSSATIQLQAPPVDPGLSTFGIYNAGAAVPPLYQVWPGSATTGWYSVLSFRNSPMRAVVNLFDGSGALQGTTTYLGADPSNMGFYLLQSPGSGGLVFYSEDARNGGARLLAFNATGAKAGATWFAWETGAGPGGDYADSIWLVQYSFAPVPVLQTSWGTLKKRFL